MKVRVLVRPKKEVPDPAGELTTTQLVSMGYSEVRGVRIGRFYELNLETGDADMASERVERMCSELLGNSVVEEWEVIPEE
jgi:phosphoribosylformylglycinamidine synthase